MEGVLCPEFRVLGIHGPRPTDQLPQRVLLVSGGYASHRNARGICQTCFDGGGFVKTSHHLTNLTVSFSGADHATVNAYVQAWHWKADNTLGVAPGIWDVELTRTAGKWLITKEKRAVVGVAIVSPSAAPLVPASPAQPPQPAEEPRDSRSSDHAFV